MTICNIYNFGYLDDYKQSWLEFRAEVSAKKEQWPYDRMVSVLSDLTEEEYESAWGDLLNPTSYLLSLEISHVHWLLQNQQLIVDCVLSGAYGISCSNIVHFTWDPIYQECYTIHVPENVTGVGLS